MDSGEIYKVRKGQDRGWNIAVYSPRTLCSSESADQNVVFDAVKCRQLVTSVTIMTADWRVSRASKMSFSTVSSALSVEYPGRYADWNISRVQQLTVCDMIGAKVRH